MLVDIGLMLIVFRRQRQASHKTNEVRKLSQKIYICVQTYRRHTRQRQVEDLTRVCFREQSDLELTPRIVEV